MNKIFLTKSVDLVLPKMSCFDEKRKTQNFNEEHR